MNNVLVLPLGDFLNIAYQVLQKVMNTDIDLASNIKLVVSDNGQCDIYIQFCDLSGS